MIKSGIDREGDGPTAVHQARGKLVLVVDPDAQIIAFDIRDSYVVWYSEDHCISRKRQRCKGMNVDVCTVCRCLASVTLLRRDFSLE